VIATNAVRKNLIVGGVDGYGVPTIRHAHVGDDLVGCAIDDRDGVAARADGKDRVCGGIHSDGLRITYISIVASTPSQDASRTVTERPA